jgi:hypothetical protein
VRVEGSGSGRDVTALPRLTGADESVPITASHTNPRSGNEEKYDK